MGSDLRFDALRRAGHRADAPCGDSVQRPSTRAVSEGLALKRHELRRAIQSPIVVLSAILFLTGIAHAQSGTPLRRNPNTSASEEARVLAQASGMSPEQVRQRLREMGQSDDEIERALHNSGSRTRMPANSEPATSGNRPAPPIRPDSLAPNLSPFAPGAP